MDTSVDGGDGIRTAGAIGATLAAGTMTGEASTARSVRGDSTS